MNTFNEYKTYELMDYVSKKCGVKQMMVLASRFGFIGGEFTLKESGILVGVGTERARQLETKALRFLRKKSNKEWLKNEYLR